jgi:hypothetical protein
MSNQSLKYPKNVSLVGILPWLPICFLLTIFFFWGWLDDVALRLITTRAQQLRILYIAMRCAAGIGIVLLVWLHIRYVATLGEWKWWSKLGQYTPGVVLLLLGLTFGLDSAMRVILIQRAQQSKNLQGIVVRSGTHRRRFLSRDYADVEVATGKRMSLESDRSLFSLLTGYAVRVNGRCKVDTLPIGLPVTIYGRQSDFGFVLDKVSSSKPCR